jgi:FkbH-like protein
MAELSRKTNQFNLALARLSDADVAALMDREDAVCVGGWLSDRLSSAGMIASMCAERVGDAAVVHELALSCRSLGRGIEDVLLTHAADAICRRLGVEALEFVYVRGPRNQPGLAWLEKFAGNPVPDAESGVLRVAWDSAARLSQIAALPAEVSWRS